MNFKGSEEPMAPLWKRQPQHDELKAFNELLANVGLKDDLLPLRGHSKDNTYGTFLRDQCLEILQILAKHKCLDRSSLDYLLKLYVKPPNKVSCTLHLADLFWLVKDLDKFKRFNQDCWSKLQTVNNLPLFGRIVREHIIQPVKFYETGNEDELLPKGFQGNAALITGNGEFKQYKDEWTAVCLEPDVCSYDATGRMIVPFCVMRHSDLDSLFCGIEVFEAVYPILLTFQEIRPIAIPLFTQPDVPAFNVFNAIELADKSNIFKNAITDPKFIEMFPEDIRNKKMISYINSCCEVLFDQEKCLTLLSQFNLDKDASKRSFLSKYLAFDQQHLLTPLLYIGLYSYGIRVSSGESRTLKNSWRINIHLSPEELNIKNIPSMIGNLTKIFRLENCHYDEAKRSLGADAVTDDPLYAMIIELLLSEICGVQQIKVQVRHVQKKLVADNGHDLEPSRPDNN